MYHHYLPIKRRGVGKTTLYRWNESIMLLSLLTGGKVGWMLAVIHDTCLFESHLPYIFSSSLNFTFLHTRYIHSTHFNQQPGHTKWS